MGAEAVVLQAAAPIAVGDGLARLLGADAVLPVVGIGKAAAGPAHDGNADLLQRVHHILAHTVDVGDGRVLAHPNAVVHQAAQMLAEVAVNVLVDVGFLVQIVNQILRHNITPIHWIWESCKAESALQLPKI